MDKRKISIVAIFAVILLAFAVIFAAVPFNRIPAVWIMFAFTGLAISFACFITLYALMTGSGTKGKVYGLPMVQIGMRYMFLQLFAAFAVMICAFKFNVPAWVPTAVSIVLFAGAFIAAVLADNARDIITELEADRTRSESILKDLKNTAAALADGCGDAETRALLEKLSEKLRFSEPVANPALLGMEKDIADGIAEIKAMLENGSEDVSERIKAVTRLVDDRNRRCKEMKA